MGNRAEASVATANASLDFTNPLVYGLSDGAAFLNWSSFKTEGWADAIGPGGPAPQGHFLIPDWSTFGQATASAPPASSLADTFISANAQSLTSPNFLSQGWATTQRDGSFTYNGPTGYVFVNNIPAAALTWAQADPGGYAHAWALASVRLVNDTTGSQGYQKKEAEVYAFTGSTPGQDQGNVWVAVQFHQGDTGHISFVTQAFAETRDVPVPIPGAVWLLGSGLVGLVGIRRRFKK